MVHVQNSRLQNSSNATVSSRKPLGTGPRATRLRLYSGFFLFSFVFTHYLNHMLGLHSLELMETGRALFNVFWRFLPVEILLALSLLAHASLALLKIAQSRSSSLSFWDGAQIILGVAIPFLIADHIFGTRGLSLRDGLDDTYTWTVWALWPSSALMQSLALFVVWVHGVIGLHFWFRLRSWYSAFLPYMFVIAVLWPVMALLGFASAGKELNLLKAQDGAIDQMLADVGFLGRDAVDWVSSMEQNVIFIAAIFVATVFTWRIYFSWRSKHASGPIISYPSGEHIHIAKGLSVLEASQLAGIPHASVCGGRGRCSTCRVRVSARSNQVPLPDEGELKVLERINAPSGVRLACQLRPIENITVVPLLPANASSRDGRVRTGLAAGAEREIVILFADIRAFTKLSEDKLPFDVVFLLNQYFRAMGQAIDDNGGQVDKFIGDGIMALFGMTTHISAGCRDALAAVAEMSKVLESLNEVLENDLPEPLRIGIGVHVGSVIVGEMGYEATSSITAIGDAVNVASRLETMSKDFEAEVVMSAEVLEIAGIVSDDFRLERISVRGREQSLQAVVFKKGFELQPYLEALEVNN